VAILGHVDLLWPQDGIAQRDRRSQNVIEAVASAEVEPRGVTLGDPAHVRAREAVGLLLHHQHRGVVLHQTGHVLHGVAVLVGHQRGDGDVAEELPPDRHEHAAVPRHDLLTRAVEGVGLRVGVCVADHGAGRVVGVIGQQVVDGSEGAVEIAVVLLPELRDVIDRQQCQLVDVAAVAALYLAGRLRSVVPDAARTVLCGQSARAERVVEGGHGLALGDRGASRDQHSHTHGADRRDHSVVSIHVLTISLSPVRASRD
jgi:hypothetical protein